MSPRIAQGLAWASDVCGPPYACSARKGETGNALCMRPSSYTPYTACTVNIHTRGLLYANHPGRHRRSDAIPGFPQGERSISASLTDFRASCPRRHPARAALSPSGSILFSNRLLSPMDQKHFQFLFFVLFLSLAF